MLWWQRNSGGECVTCSYHCNVNVYYCLRPILCLPLTVSIQENITKSAFLPYLILFQQIIVLLMDHTLFLIVGIVSCGYLIWHLYLLLWHHVLTPLLPWEPIHSFLFTRPNTIKHKHDFTNQCTRFCVKSGFLRLGFHK